MQDYSHQIIMDFKTVATKVNTITTAAKGDAADLTENDDVVETSKTKNEETTYEELHLCIIILYGAQGFKIFWKNFHVVPNIFAWGT